jgi:eukaryotic-like serine/threonine-protein kinase
VTATFPPYVTEELVSEGVSLTVWRARHPELGRLVAIKALGSALREDPAALTALRTEAQVLTQLDHPHIVAIYDFVEEGEQPYLVTEWVDGESLRELLTHSGPLRPEQSLGVMRGALQGLAFAHERRLVHGDIAPSNLVLDREGTTKLIDFGLAAPVGVPGVSGTPAYLSPEAASGSPLLPQSDVYSAAAVLYHLLSGAPVFSGKDVVDVVRAHRDDLPPPLEDHGAELRQLLDRALMKDPHERPADAGEFLALLESAASARYGAAWLSVASVAGLVSVGTAAGMTTAAMLGGAASTATEEAGVATTLPASGLVTATADTGSAAPASVPVQSGRMSRLGHGMGAHPVAVGAVSVVAVAAVVTVAVVASSSSKSKPKPSPAAILLASSPRGSFSATGGISSTTDSTLKVGKLGTFPWTITEKCGPKSCASTVSAPGSTFPFVYDGKVFTSSTTTRHRLTCIDPKTGKPHPGSSALRTRTLVWTLQITKRAPATADGPGAPLELSGDAVDTTTDSAPLGGCEIPKPTSVTRYTYTAKRK